MQSTLAPTQFFILGGSGDLSKRKLLPALFDLYTKNALPDTFQVVGIARAPRIDEEFRGLVTDALKQHGHNHDPVKIADFCSRVKYVAGDFTDKKLYEELQNVTIAFNSEIKQCSNTLFYLAVPPPYYEDIFTNLHHSGLSVPCDDVTGWTRILVEKPFGQDHISARELDSLLGSLYREEQIFRIDHYIAKEAIQNILSFRFANILLRDQWCARTIKSIYITMHETVDVGERGSFYDGIGALRDVGQNHLLQLLALITMEEPEQFTAKAIREQRTKMLETLIPMTPHTISTLYRRARYQGYSNVSGVAEDSTTETAFCMVTHLSDPRWEGVPITIESAKATSQKCVRARIEFHDVATGIFETNSCHTTGNVVELTIEPTQAMQLTLNGKAPGLGFQLESRTLSFACSETTHEIKNAYERVLMDCITGDQTLFISSAEVAAQWRFISSILENQTDLPLEEYEVGSDQPFK